ncbi:hypothetical protein [Muribaculum intestinale]|uniref:hypothetical protein n=1 Tax=Muribaculum intestinale TaxID=1796646 RepID=UPI003F66A374
MAKNRHRSTSDPASSPRRYITSEKRLSTMCASDLSPLNEWWSAVPSLGERRSQISALVKEKTGRKMLG